MIAKFASAVFCATIFSAGASAALKAGSAAPAFTVQAAQGGKEFTFSLADALKSGPVVVYFYPKSFTSICTVEAHEFAENFETFKKAGAAVIGISADPINVQKEFSAKECRDKFPAGADPGLSVIKAYDAGLNMHGLILADRISYVISPEGKILSTYAGAGADGHIKNALMAIKAWSSGHKS